MTILTRASKGQALTDAEIDNNFTELRDRPTGQVYPKTAGVGIKIDTSNPNWGWEDLMGTTDFHLSDSPPTAVAYNGNIKAYQYSVGNYLVWNFHLKHDYAPGTDLFIHAHWSHNSPLTPTGDIEMTFEAMYAKGHNQAAFGSPIITNVTQTCSPIIRQHMIAEDHLTQALGAGGHIPTEDIEVDTLIVVHAKLTDCTLSNGVLPFIHCVDIHYQSTNLATKNKAPSFYA